MSRNHQLSRYGAIAKSLPFTTGKVFIVCNSSDSFLPDIQEQFPVDSEGVARVYTSLSAAYDATVSGRGDVIVLSSNGTHTLTSMLNITKNRVHFIGLDLRGGYGMGARSKVSLTATTGATNIATIQNTGVGNTFTGIKFMNSSTVTEGIYCVAEGGEYTVYDRCEFYKDTDLDETGAAEVLANGDSTQYIKCVFGSSANETVGAVIRPCMKVTATLSGKKMRDNIVDSCIFLTKSANTARVDVYGANATDVERMLLIKDSVFLSNTLGSATPAHAVGFGSAQTEGVVILKNCTSVDHTVMAQASKNIYVDGAVPTFATTGVSVAS